MTTPTRSTTPTVVIVGTLDTKLAEHQLLRRLVETAGCATHLIDVGIAAHEPIRVDTAAEAVAEAGGTRIADLRDKNDRGSAVTAMARGAAKIVRQLFDDGRLQAVVSLGGSGGASIATAAMRTLPIGIPKLMVTTVAAGDVGPYVGTSDIMMLYPVVDVAGVNAISERIITNAAAAIAAMAMTSALAGPIVANRPVVAITMFGVTTPAAMVAKDALEAAGFDVLIFHANGAGGRTMEALIGDGVIAGVLDLTTTELADELVGGTLSAGPERLEIAGRRGLPQVVSLGALDMVNFGPVATVPERFKGRNLYAHNPTVTLMRTTPEECAALGTLIARKLNSANGPVAVFAPTRGVSAIAKQGGPFADAAADAALIDALRRDLDPSIPLRLRDTDINDPAFAREMAAALVGMMST